MQPNFRLNSVSLRNFRGFKQAIDIPLAPLTFLVGPNSSGKSSIFGAIGLLAQSGISPSQLFRSDVNWTGQLADLGSFRDVVYRQSTHRTMQIGLEFSSDLSDFHWWRTGPSREGNLPVRLDIAFRRFRHDHYGGGHLSESGYQGGIHYCEFTDVTTNQKLRLTPNRSLKTPTVAVSLLGTTRRISIAPGLRRHRVIDQKLSKVIGDVLRQHKNQLHGKSAAWKRLNNFVTGFGVEMFLHQIQRVSSGRGGPKRWYPIMGTAIYTSPYDMQPCFDTVDPAMVDRSMEAPPEEQRRRRRKKAVQTEKVLRDMDIASHIEAHQLSPYHRSIRVTDSITKVRSNLIDIGYGASQIIPVILACQSDFAAPLLVEQPEIHLHPKAQGRVADLLIQTSSDRQVLVETHSVHLINRARLRIAEGSLSASDVTVLFVNRNANGSYVQQIPIGRDGEFKVEWPEGFFEERYQETLALMAAKSKSTQ